MPSGPSAEGGYSALDFKLQQSKKGRANTRTQLLVKNIALLHLPSLLSGNRIWSLRGRQMGLSGRDRRKGKYLLGPSWAPAPSLSSQSAACSDGSCRDPVGPGRSQSPGQGPGWCSLWARAPAQTGLHRGHLKDRKGTPSDLPTHFSWMCLSHLRQYPCPFVVFQQERGWTV